MNGRGPGGSPATAFPGMLAGSWMGGKVVETQTNTWQEIREHVSVARGGLTHWP